MYQHSVYGYGSRQPQEQQQEQQQQQQQSPKQPYAYTPADSRNLANFNGYMPSQQQQSPKTINEHKDPSLLQHFYDKAPNNQFTSQDIVTGLTQPVNYNNHNIGRIVGDNSELPTLPPLNTTSNKPRERWIPEDDRTTTPLMSPQQQDPSVLMQYQNVRNDRRLMSPYPPRQQMMQQPAYPDMFPKGSDEEMGPYGCGVMGCVATFSSSNGLFYHMKNVHPNIEEVYKPYRCAMPNCPKRYKNINGLQYHLREAKGSSGHGNLANEQASKAFQCQLPGCKKAYRTQNGLRYHQQHGHNLQPMMEQQHLQQQQQQQQQMPPHLLLHEQQQNVLNHMQDPQQFRLQDRYNNFK